MMSSEEAAVHLQLALEAAHMAVWESDVRNGKVDLGVVRWSARGAALLGFEPRAIEQGFRDYLACVHPNDRERVRDTIQHAVEQRTDYELEYRVIWPDQSLHWLAAKGRVLFDRQRHCLKSFGIIWETTDAKRTQERLSLALEAASMTVWETDLHERQVHWSEHGAKLLGLPPIPFQCSFEENLRFIHPDDRMAVRNAIQHAIDAGNDYQIEHRVVWPDATVRWIAMKGQVHLLRGAGSTKILGVIWDITDRKMAELALTEQKELAEVTLDSIGDGVITTDAGGQIQSLNRVAEELTGWPADQAKGQPADAILKVIDEATRELLENVAKKCLRLRHTVAVSSRGILVARDGRKVPLQDSASPILAHDGRILGAVVVFRDVSHERHLKHELSWQASHDALTGLINRREFEVQVAAALATAQQEHDCHALLFLDLDQFKIVNDTCGHIAGDELLRQLTSLLQSKMRDSDVLARIGGDELGVLLRNCPVGQARYLAEHLRQTVKDFRFVWEKNSFEIGVSIGLVEINQDSKSLSDLLSAADRACYVAKEQGRNRVHFYEESDVVIARRHGEMLWVSRLNDAFDHDRFRLYSQSIVGLNDGGALQQHVEVLVRMMDVNGQIVLPGAFIPAAERYDLMPLIDRWVVQTLFRHIRQASEAGKESGGAVDITSYAVNLSGISLNDDSLMHFIIEQFEEHGVAPASICFEITETAAIGNLSKAKRFMEELKKLGCTFALDDFGSGLSSFAYLKNLPVDYLKIDGSFVKDIATDAVNRAMVAAINEVGHVMGLKTIAEYVENDSILEEVQGIGIDYAQGYAVGGLKPLV